MTFTWEFAAAWLARRLGADHWLGSRLHPDGSIEHVWAEDKARWLADLMRARDVRRDEAAAVGDSWRDVSMFEVVGRSFYVGATPPPGVDVVHLPDGDIHEIARRIVAAPGASDLRLVPFAPEHAAGVIDVIRAVFDEYRMTFDLSDFDADLQHVERHYLESGGMFCVLLEADRVVGTVAVVPRVDGDCELKRLYLGSSLRGRRQGRRLLEHAIAWARARGYHRMIAWSDVRLGTAHEVYKRMGFTVAGERVVEDIDRSRELGFVLDLNSLQFTSL